jgi:hypothetical protein
MTRERVLAWGIGSGLAAGLAAGGVMFLTGYEFLAAGVAIVVLCLTSLSVGAWLSRTSAK